MNRTRWGTLSIKEQGENRLIKKNGADQTMLLFPVDQGTGREILVSLGISGIQAHGMIEHINMTPPCAYLSLNSIKRRSMTKNAKNHVCVS